MRNGCVFKETKMAATKEIKEERLGVIRKIKWRILFDVKLISKL